MAKGKIYLVALLLVAAAMPVLGSTISTQIREGVYKEEVEGDLDAAIKIYEGIITAHADNQRYAAQATYRLGLCYLKKGQNDKAIEQFERIVKDYPTEKSTVRKAKQQLKKLKPASNDEDSMMMGGPRKPSVIDSFPKTYSNDVSADVDKLTVTFDQPMIKENFSWVKWNYTFPETTGKPYYDEKATTCTLPVKLEPGTAYLLRINAKQYSSFMNLKGVQAQPFVLVFATKDKNGKPTPIPEEMLKFAKYINGQQVQTTDTLSSGPLKLIDAPWVDNEKMVLELKTPAGMDIGNISYTAKTQKRGGKDLWVIESYMTIPIQRMQQYTRVDAEIGTYKPVYGQTKNWMGNFKADYSEGKVSLKTDKIEKDFDVSTQVYDNEQALFLIRSMPLSVGFEQSFDIFPVQSGSITKCTINVTGKEKVKVKSGDYDCFKVNLACYSGAVKALEHTLWFSADKHHYLVKYDSGAAIMELSEVGLVAKGPQTVRDAKYGYYFNLPDGWMYADIASGGSRKVSQQLIPPRMSSMSVLCGVENLDSKKTIKSIAKEDMGLLKGSFKDYSLRKNSWIERKINNLNASFFIYDFEDKGMAMVEYRAYIKSHAMVYWFVFRVEKDKFDEFKPQYDSIINSFKVDASPVSSNKAKAEQLAAEGWKLWGQRKLADAEAKFKEAIAADASCENAYQGLGWAQFNQGKNNNAKDSFERCIKLNAENSAALNGLGWIAHGDGKTDEAVQWWEKAVKAQPGATASLSGLCKVYMEKKDYEKAIKYYKMWLKVEPNNQQAKDGLENAKGLLGRENTN